MRRELLYAWIFVSLKVVICCSDADGSQNLEELKEDVNVPSYYIEQLNEKETAINDVVQNSSNSVSFVFITDVHWGDNQRHSPELIQHIITHTPIDDVVFGGDVITTSFDTPQKAVGQLADFRHAFDRLSCNVYYLYGNHDNNSDSHPNETQRHLTEEQVYDNLQKGMGECVYGGYYNFFFDREKSKTRFICLDTGRYYYSQLRGNTIETVKFLTSTLESTPAGWNVVLMSHLWCDLNYEKPRTAYISSYMKTIIKVADDFNAGVNGIFKYKGDTVEYDFSESTSKILCCIGGHCHLDSVLYSENGIPLILTTTDSNHTLNGEKAKSGTINEQAVTVFVLDYSNEAIRMFRVGRGKDAVVPIK